LIGHQTDRMSESIANFWSASTSSPVRTRFLRQQGLARQQPMSGADPSAAGR